MTNRKWAEWCKSVLFLAIVAFSSVATFFTIYFVFGYLPKEIFSIKTLSPLVIQLFVWIGGGVSLGVGVNMASKILIKIKIIPKEE